MTRRMWAVEIGPKNCIARRNKQSDSQLKGMFRIMAERENVAIASLSDSIRTNITAQPNRDLKMNQTRHRKINFVAFAAFFAIALPTGTAWADTFTIDTLVDTNDGVGVNGTSLREAIIAANANGEDDTIIIDEVFSDSIFLTSDLPTITTNMVIIGSGTIIGISGQDMHRVFTVTGATTEVTFRDISIRNGLAQGGDGGATISGGGGGGAAGMGGAMFIDDGVVILDRVRFSDSEATGGDGGTTSGSFASGGGGGGLGANGNLSTGGGGGFLGGSAGSVGYPGGNGGEGAGAGGGGLAVGDGGNGGFGGGGGGGGLGDSMGSNTGGVGGNGGFGAGGGGAGRNSGGGASPSGGSGGTHGGDGGTGSDGSQGFGGGGAGLGGLLFVRDGHVELFECEFIRGTATGGNNGGGDATDGEGKGGAIYINSGATVAGLDIELGIGGNANSASDDNDTDGDNDDVFGTILDIPVVASVARQGSGAVNDSQVTFTVTFSEAVTGVGTDDFELTTTGPLTGASIVSALSVSSNTVFSVVVNTGNGDGTIHLNIVDDDSIQNGSTIKLNGTGTDTSATGIGYEVDKSKPAVTSITPITGSPTNADTISYDVVFDESVTGFDEAADITVDANGATFDAAAITQNSGTTYRVNVTGVDGDGTIKVTVKSGVASDEAGNTNASTLASNTITVDNTAPSITSIATPTAMDAFGRLIFTVTFAQAVTGFTSNDITINHDGTAHEAIAIEADSNAVYRVIVTGVSGTGSATATIKANAVTDSAGNGNAAKTSEAVTVSNNDSDNGDDDDEDDGDDEDNTDEEELILGGLCGASMPMAALTLLPLMVLARRRS